MDSSSASPSSWLLSSLTFPGSWGSWPCRAQLRWGSSATDLLLQSCRAGAGGRPGLGVGRAVEEGQGAPAWAAPRSVNTHVPHVYLCSHSSRVFPQLYSPLQVRWAQGLNITGPRGPPVHLATVFFMDFFISLQGKSCDKGQSFLIDAPDSPATLAYRSIIQSTCVPESYALLGVTIPFRAIYGSLGSLPLSLEWGQ